MREQPASDDGPTSGERDRSALHGDDASTGPHRAGWRMRREHGPGRWLRRTHGTRARLDGGARGGCGSCAGTRDGAGHELRREHGHGRSAGPGHDRGPVDSGAGSRADDHRARPHDSRSASHRSSLNAAAPRGLPGVPDGAARRPRQALVRAHGDVPAAAGCEVRPRARRRISSTVAGSSARIATAKPLPVEVTRAWTPRSASGQ